MQAPTVIPLRVSAQTTTPGTTTGTGVTQRDSISGGTAVLEVSAIGLLTQATDTLDVYVDASHDGGTTYFNIGRFLRITGVSSAYATGTLTSTGAITSGIHAQSVITSDTTNVSNNEEVVIDGTIYRFRSTPAQAYDVQIGIDAATSLANLKAAINASGTPGVEYFAGTLAHSMVVGYTLTATTLLVRGRTTGTAYNAAATTTTSVHLSWEAVTLGAGTGASVAGVNGETVTVGVKVYTFVAALSETAGATAVANEVLYGSSVTTAFANLRSAVNATAGAGTNYATGTTANAGATATASDATTVSFQAVTIGTPGNSIVTEDTMANGAFGAVTLTGGTYGPGVNARQSLTWSASAVETSQPVDIETDIASTSGGIRQVGIGQMLRYRGVVSGATADFTYSVYFVGKQ